MSRSTWDERIARAGELANKVGGAAEVLHFYQALLREQESWCQAGELTSEFIADRFQRLLDFLELKASDELALVARAMGQLGPERWESMVQGYWTGGGNLDDAFFARAFLEPYAEASCPQPPGAVPDTVTRCPCCGQRPIASVLRQEYEGARRSLVCSLCHWEWKFRRILCASCREENFDSLPVFHVAEFPHLRIETCDKCGSYLLCVDMTRDPKAVPEVDDIAALPLHIWAREEGYRRLQTNLLGL